MLESDFLTFEFNIMEVVHPGGGGGGEDATDLIIIPIPGTLMHSFILSLRTIARQVIIESS